MLPPPSSSSSPSITCTRTSRERARRTRSGRGLNGWAGLSGVTNAHCGYFNIQLARSRGGGHQHRDKLTATSRRSFIFTPRTCSMEAPAPRLRSGPGVGSLSLGLAAELFTATTRWTSCGRTLALRYGMQIRTLTSAIMWLLA